TIATQFVRELSHRVAAKAGGEGVIVYFDRAELVASFLLDVHAGKAYGSWGYAEFEGLKYLPFSAAVRTLFEWETATVLQALSRLSEGPLREVMRAIPDFEARRIVALFRSTPGHCDDLALVELAWSSMQRLSIDVVQPLAPRDRLILLVELTRH